MNLPLPQGFQCFFNHGATSTLTSSMSSTRSDSRSETGAIRSRGHRPGNASFPGSRYRRECLYSARQAACVPKCAAFRGKSLYLYPFHLVQPFAYLETGGFKPDVQGPGIGRKPEFFRKLVHIRCKAHVIPPLPSPGMTRSLEDELVPPVPKHPAVIRIFMPQDSLPRSG